MTGLLLLLVAAELQPWPRLGRCSWNCRKLLPARMAELVDAPDLGSGSERSKGSSPFLGNDDESREKGRVARRGSRVACKRRSRNLASSEGPGFRPEVGQAGEEDGKKPPAAELDRRGG
jgi:hypothetical protein